jgi:cyclic pyranopterin phosphate synthase
MVDYNIRDRIRRGDNREELAQFLIDTVLKKEAGHRINEADFVQPPRAMVFIGG